MHRYQNFWKLCMIRPDQQVVCVVKCFSVLLSLDSMKYTDDTVLKYWYKKKKKRIFNWLKEMQASLFSGSQIIS